MINKIVFALLFALGASATTPNDPLFSKQWSLVNDGTEIDIIDFDNLHTIYQKGVPGVDIGWSVFQDQSAKLAKSPVIVAVIDSGIEPTHPDLVGRISSDGYDFLKASSVMTDLTGHGTEVAGIIAANSANGIGVAGIAPASVTILPLGILGGNGQYQNFAFKGKLLSDYAADAIRYAIAHKASVINMSFGWPALIDNDNVRKAVSEATSAGVLIVAAAGNDRKANPSFPCTYEGVICVGSVSNTGATTFYSDFGGLVDLVAPGDDIVTTLPLSISSKVLDMVGYESVVGTSFSAPIVAAVAATLKSMNPKISLSELRARVLASASSQTKSLSLYGMVNLAKAATLAPRPVFYPHFKGHSEVVVNEKTLGISDSITLENLWANAGNVSVKVLVNSKLAGSAQAASLAQGQSMTIPWQYNFASLDDSSLVKLSVQVTSANLAEQTFDLELTCVRGISSLAKQKVISIAGIDAKTWMPTSNNLNYSNLVPITRYGESTGTPLYFIKGNVDPDGTNIQIFDPMASPQVQNVKVPVQIIGEVIKLKLANSSWVVTGTKSVGNKPYLVFYFLNDQFQNTSTWQLLMGALEFGLVRRSFSAPGSWIAYNGSLIPSFVASGQLPPQDNYDGLDPRHGQSTTHLYYLLPLASSDSLNQMSLQLRALDSKTLRDGYPNFNILNLVPPSDQDQQAGHVRVLVTLGTNVNAQTLTWDISSTVSTQAALNSGWDVPSSSGNPHKVFTVKLDNGVSAFNTLFDSENGSLAWLDSSGHFFARTEYTYKDLANQILQEGVVGAYQLPNLDRAWFVETRYDLVGYYQAKGQSSAKMYTISLDRDSTFSAEQIDSLLSPVLLGTTAKPIPGLFVDSTLVRGDLLSIATLNSSSAELRKPLRYSLQMMKSTASAACLPMGTFYASSNVESLSLSLLCRKDSQLEFHILPMN